MTRRVPTRVLALLPVLALLGAACGGGDDDDASAASEADPTVADTASVAAVDTDTAPEDLDLGAGSTEVGVANSDGGSPLAEESDDGDNVQFVTNPPTTTSTTTTTLPPTTTSTSTSTTTTTTTSTSTSTSTSTTTTTPPPTSIRCSFAADALFEPGEAVLTEQATLDLGAVITEFDDVRSVRVEGHTDHRGSEAENLALSQARADAAAAALVDAGIDEADITAVGLGEAAAHQDNPTDEDMAGDRRVDVVIDADVPITTTC